MDRERQAAWGRIGGLTAHSRHSADEMLSGAREGFRERFRRQVAEAAAQRGECLTPAEAEARAMRLLRAHMLRLAVASAQARRKNGPRAA
jgi:hypothetical protein